MIKKVLRWVFFGELDHGLEKSVLCYSVLISGGSYLFGYEVWAFVLSARDPMQIVVIPFEMALILCSAVFAIFIGWFKFRATPTSGISLGALLLFLCGTLPAGSSSMEIATAGLVFVLRGFSAGPAHEQELI